MSKNVPLTPFADESISRLIQRAKEILAENQISFVEEEMTWSPVVPDNVFSIVDLTNLKPDALSSDILSLCESAKQLKCAAVCVNSINLPVVIDNLKDSAVKPITVVGFPLGQSHVDILCLEIQKAIELGAQEIDMVMPASMIKNQQYVQALNYLKSARNACTVPLKVIFETSLHSNQDIAILALLCRTAKVDFVKTSTGFGASGASTFDVALMRKCVGNNIGVKASGGIKSTAAALQLVLAGASRIGASSLSQVSLDNY